METEHLPRVFRCEPNPLPEIPPNDVAVFMWVEKSGFSWQPDKEVKRICGNADCVNPWHIYPSYPCKESQKVETLKQHEYRIRLREVVETMATLDDLQKESISQMDDRQAELHVLKLREERRSMAAGNKVAKKISTKTVSKKTRREGRSLEAQLEDMSVEELEKLAATLAGVKS